jgi:predicted RNA-binding protein with PUA-like domain
MAKKPARSAARGYWLFKSEPEAFSIDDLAAAKGRTTFWDGVRNYQARNFLRDTVRVGDRAFFYHSNADPLSIVGTVEVVKAGYPDHTAFDPRDHHYDPDIDPDNPTWYMVDVKLLQKFAQPVTREMLRDCADLADMMVLRKGARLSIQPVTETEWRAVHGLAGVRDV